MATKAKNPMDGSLAVPSGNEHETAVEEKKPMSAEIAINAEGLATIVTASFVSNMYKDIGSGAVYKKVKERTDAVQKGSMDLPERMLMSQALALQAVFTELMQRASSVKDLNRLQPLMQLALKAQSNCRVTLETLNEFKNPRSVAFVRQTNVANGPQQVNVGTGPQPALNRAHGKNKTALKTSKLLEDQRYGNTQMDTRATATTARSHSAVEAVGPINRPPKPARKEKSLSKPKSSRIPVEGVV